VDVTSNPGWNLLDVNVTVPVEIFRREKEREEEVVEKEEDVKEREDAGEDDSTNGLVTPTVDSRERLNEVNDKSPVFIIAAPTLSPNLVLKPSIEDVGVMEHCTVVLLKSSTLSFSLSTTVISLYNFSLYNYFPYIIIRVFCLCSTIHFLSFYFPI
jgi:hypothetical protein